MIPKIIYIYILEWIKDKYYIHISINSGLFGVSFYSSSVTLISAKHVLFYTGLKSPHYDYCIYPHTPLSLAVAADSAADGIMVNVLCDLSSMSRPP